VINAYWYVLIYKREAHLGGFRGQGTVATHTSPDLQEPTAKYKSAIYITGVNKIAPNFVTLVVTYVCDVQLFKHFTE
jgi:hypothetical protein